MTYETEVSDVGNEQFRPDTCNVTPMLVMIDCMLIWKHEQQCQHNRIQCISQLYQYQTVQQHN